MLTQLANIYQNALCLKNSYEKNELTFFKEISKSLSEHSGFNNSFRKMLLFTSFLLCEISDVIFAIFLNGY